MPRITLGENTGFYIIVITITLMRFTPGINRYMALVLLSTMKYPKGFQTATAHPADYCNILSKVSRNHAVSLSQSPSASRGLQHLPTQGADAGHLDSGWPLISQVNSH